MQAILMHWFVAQQQTSIFRRHKVALIYVKFSAELYGLSPNFQKQQERAKNWPKVTWYGKAHICT